MYGMKSSSIAVSNMAATVVEVVIMLEDRLLGDFRNSTLDLLGTIAGSSCVFKSSTRVDVST